MGHKTRPHFPRLEKKTLLLLLLFRLPLSKQKISVGSLYLTEACMCALRQGGLTYFIRKKTPTLQSPDVMS